MSFDANDPKLTAYVFGELDEAARAEFEQQLEASDELRRLVDQTRQTVAAVQREMRAEPPLRLTTAQRTAVRDAVRSDVSPPVAHRPDTASGSARRNWILAGCLAATVAAVAVGIALLPAVQSSREAARRMARLDPTGLGDSHASRAVSAALEQEEVAERQSSLARSARDEAATQMLAEGANLEFLPARSRRLATAPSAPASGPAADALAAGTGDAASRRASRFGYEASSAASQPIPVPGESGANGGLPASPAGDAPFGRQSGLGGYPGSAPAAGPEPAPAAEHSALGLRDKDSDAKSFTVGGRGLDGTEPPLPAEPGFGPGDEGRGPGQGGDKFDPIEDNPFVEVKNEPLSTFSIDVDTASYAKTRMFLLERGMMPRRDAVRIEELLNYFVYDYEPPTGPDPFAAHLEVADCPWNPRHRLVRIGVKGKQIERQDRPTSNLVFLLDVSGSMSRPNKLPLVKQSMKLLVDELGENDRVAIVVYAGAAGLVLESTPGDRKRQIMDALDRLHAGGSTNGGQGVRLAYQTALDNYVEGGVNRVVLCTDGDFNVGVTGTDELVRLCDENARAGVFLSVLGFGMGNHNDAMLEQISNKGNGNYAFIDSIVEARKVLVEQLEGTLVTIAKDVKIQVEFNPQEVAAYRLIGYENRILAAQDFNDDRKDAGEIGAGHTVTALYELVPAGAATDVAIPPVDPLRYQQSATLTEQADSGEMLTLKMRYKQPDGDTSKLLIFPLRDSEKRIGQTSKDYRFAAAVAAFGMLLRDSPHKGDANYDAVLEIAREGLGEDRGGYRAEFLQMVERARELSGRVPPP